MNKDLVDLLLTVSTFAVGLVVGLANYLVYNSFNWANSAMTLAWLVQALVGLVMGAFLRPGRVWVGPFGMLIGHLIAVTPFVFADQYTLEFAPLTYAFIGVLTLLVYAIALANCYLWHAVSRSTINTNEMDR